MTCNMFHCRSYKN